MSKHPPLDEGVKLPKAVRNLAQRAEELHGNVYTKPQDDPAAPTPELAPALAEPAAAAPAEPPAAAVQPPPLAEPPAGPTPEPAPTPEPPTNWERAFKSMKGRHARAEQTIGQMRDRIGQLEAMLAELQRTPRQPDEPAEKLITDKDLEDYGPDLINVVGKKAKEEFNPVVTKLQREIEDLKSKMTGTEQQVAVTARQRMLQELDRLVPTWKELDTDERFLEWLALPDRFSRAIRHELLARAYQHNDAATVAEFFNGFLAEEAATDPAKAVETQPPAPPAPPAPKVSLEQFAAPGRAKSTAASVAPVEKPTISRAQISQFYADKNRGRYSSEEAQRLERMIFDAQADGRIIN